MPQLDPDLSLTQAALTGAAIDAVKIAVELAAIRAAMEALW